MKKKRSNFYKSKKRSKLNLSNTGESLKGSKEYTRNENRRGPQMFYRGQKLSTFGDEFDPEERCERQ
ncbi:MAG: hypothetical protein LBH47_01970 [Christensenellaceae bacterium]|jgi:hypothetical protein|nr:hypothetical protein [Christensenellaceae bacterium]